MALGGYTEKGEGVSLLSGVRDSIRSCIQCGTCTASCPLSFAMDQTPRRMWRMVLAGREEELFRTRTFALCSACYCCTLRCPRGLPLTEAMAALKRLAAGRNLHKGTTLFYRSFLDCVRRSGRLRETPFMMLYFISMKNPYLPIRFVPLAWKLLARKKVSLMPVPPVSRPLEALFRKVEELEEGS